MTEYYLYTTSKNDRWDTIATRFYGNCFEINPIIEANEHVAIKAVFEEGTLLRVPVKENTTPGISDVLPVWKRGD